MTVRELYDYAVSHSLLDHQVEDNDRLNKVEWSIEDVLWLFSN